ncbi:outer membrane beta-barrel protein [uncultured Litoreibacter sp.]|uniref:outer membrane protein transport protein n=1 Tax=uncultured Litoreibacter sp. TaxID=1392394 RepID=UPI00260223A5|nr:outer membrane beta-barrel protein [uncultured Litoreibacter sp.]
MKRITTAAVVLAATTSMASAGGIDRSGQSLRALFEDGGETGNYAELSYSFADPTANGSLGSDDGLDAYSQFGLAYKTNLTDQLSFALILDTPFAANVTYGAGPFAGGTAQIDSTAFTGVLRYKFNNGFSVHGGLRLQELGGTIVSIGLLQAESDLELGYVAGVAYERPDIALRVALTYNSEIDHGLTGTENVVNPTAFTVTTPASWNLDFQTGIAENTLLFGSVRYVEWAGFNLTTPGLGTYANFTANTTSYTLGVGRKFNENWSGAVTIGYESPTTRPTTTPLAPTAGFRSIGLGATYTQGNTKISGGVTYGKLGDQSFGPVTWTDNDVFGAGVRVGFNF